MLQRRLWKALAGVVAIAVALAAALPVAALAEPAAAEEGGARLLGAPQAGGEAAGTGAPDPAAALLGAQADCDGTRQAFLEVVDEQAVRSYWSGWDNNVEYNGWNGEPWCGHFVAWCARVAGVSEDHIPDAYTAKSVPRFSSWFKDRGAYHYSWDSYEPKAGDVAFLDDNGHVGVVVGRSGSDVVIKEGNVGNGGANDEVQVNTYWKSGGRICGYGETWMPERTEPDPYPIPDYDFGPNVSLPQGDGVYSIASTLDKSLFVEVEGGGTQNEARVQLWRGEDTDFRRWRFSRNDDGTYTIYAVHSGMVLDVRGGSREAGAKVQQFGYHGGDNQKWWLQDCGDGSYALKSVISRGFLDVTGGWDNLGPGVEMEQWSGHGKEEARCSEKFIIEPSFGHNVSLPQGDCTYSIASVANPSNFVGVSGGSTESGASLTVSEGEDRDFKRWNFRCNDDGTYTIFAVHSGGVIDVFDGSTENGAKVLQFGRKTSGDDNQRWWLEDMGYGVYMLKAKSSGKFLDVKDGSQLVQWRGHGEANQRFVISPSYGPSTALPGGDGVYIIAPADEGSRVVEVEGASKSEEANVRAASWTGASNQRFLFTREADGAYTIAAAHSGLLLDVWNGEADAGRWDCGNVQQYRDKGDANQRWWLEDLGDGTYAVKSKFSGKHLTVAGGEGSNLMQCFGGSEAYANQRFRIEPWANDLSAAEVSPIGPQPWLGVAAEPRPEVRLGGAVLAEGVDYELSWEDNAWPGTARVTATGVGDYTGSRTVEFTVQGYEIDRWVDLPGGGKGYAKDGRLVTGWMDLKGAKYWFRSDGSMATGWTDVVVNGKTMHYYFNPASGNLVRGTWFEIDGFKYYFRPSGNVAHGWATISDNGVDKKYYFDDEYHMVTGWRDIDNGQGQVNHYYFRPSGSMATGWATIDGEKYWFRPSGNMATGFTTVDDGYKRYFDKSGHMLLGWQQIGGKTYYFRVPSGAMQTGEAVIDGKRYVFSDKGVLVDGPLAAQSDGDVVKLDAQSAQIVEEV